MIKNTPILNAPKTNSKNEFKIFSNNFISFIKKFFVDLKDDIDIEKKISIKNNYYNEDYFDGQYKMYDIIQNTLYNQINDYSFWSNLLACHICDYRFKKGIKAGMFCGKPIEISCNNMYGKYRCSKHISKKYYTPICKKDPEKLCKGLNNIRRPCQNYKHFGNYCIYHKDNIFMDEINILLSIEYDVNIAVYIIDEKKELDIKHNNGICIEQDKNGKLICNNIVSKNEDLCYKHVDEQCSIYSCDSIRDNDYTNEYLDETINYINDNIKKNKDECNLFFNKIQKKQLFNKKIIENKDDKTSISSVPIISDNMLEFNKYYKFILDYIKNINKKNQEYKNHKCIDINLFKSENKINFINNNTFININYLEDKLKITINKFIDFKNEISQDFPKYYKILKGYFEILELEYKNDIFRYIELAKIKSILI